MPPSNVAASGINQFFMNFLFLNSARHGWGGNEKWTKLASEALSGEHRCVLAYRDPMIGRNFCIPKTALPFTSEIDPLTIKGLVRIIRREQIDVLIPTKRKDYMLAGIASRLCGKANILRLGIDRPIGDTLLHRIVYRYLADGIIVNAARIKEQLVSASWLDHGKIRVIYNGLDRETVECRSLEPYNKPFVFMIAAAGSLTGRKGFDFLIRSFGRFIRHGKTGTRNAGLVIAGDGPDRTSLEKLVAEQELVGRVLFTGHLDNPYTVMRASDIFVSSSISEGLSNALLESMLLETVPVSTFSGGAEEAITDGVNGFLVPYGEEEQLASLFDRLLGEPEARLRIARRAVETVRERFSLEIMSREIVDFCHEVIERRGRR